ncbi:hypothetical protein Tsubulata_025136 [Turnera subulata]|uniref:non-specific serine/threonine protein kinase n=1 Tax=Turnera subulata TaxID=218843 RepID=A0A9Q0J6I7_9ROSI|nr:hypothetical protein Tsubulata_025136 [Turnera subulata]
MKMLQHFFFAIFGILALEVLVDGLDQVAGFINLDCGLLPPNTSYSDPVSGLIYTSDSSHVDTGVSEGIAAEYRTNSVDQQEWFLRSFPEGVRNCYKIEVTKGTKYLIRATFFYGNYDRQYKLPAFDLYLGPNKWLSVQIQNVSRSVITEIINIPTLNYAHVCLVKTDQSSIPFISVLELRPLRNTTYVTESGSLVLFNRVDAGSMTNRKVRYPDDVYDRIWFPYNFNRWSILNTSQTVDYQGNSEYQPPSVVMSTAATPTNASDPIIIDIQNRQNESMKMYYYMHFAEIVKLQANQSRIFNISLNGQPWYGLYTPKYLYTETVYTTSPDDNQTNEISIFKVGNSTLPPLLNALEAYYLVDLKQSPTDQGDVDAILSIKSTYGISRNWQGDPCAPEDYVWEDVTCSYNGTAPPRIIRLNLSAWGLLGEISSEFANLKSLETLDLSNNNLTGQVPDFFSPMQSLKVLNLSGNHLTGNIPDNLYARAQRGSLSLRVDDNPGLCQSVSCKGKSNNTAVKKVVASVAAVFVLVAVVVVALCIFRRRKHQVMTSNAAAHEPLEAKKRQFAYSEVLSITNNFEKIIGKGGFGIVYYGFLEGTQVAVKMLSQSSAQGYKEFQAEVKLLLRVHHRNLTSLIGYCNEGVNLALIYEYMANGNLKQHLSGLFMLLWILFLFLTDAGAYPHTLDWETRIRIAVEAAQGLEYLHNGCKPPILHRDVKTTNILLNENFQAKLSDFGLSKTFQVESESHMTTVPVGTPGYLDPEYWGTNWLTEKSDVYSFGVVLLEIITSRAVIVKDNETNGHISDWVRSVIERGDIRSIIDPKLRGNYDVNSGWRVVELALSCVSSSPADRPFMNQVVTELNECFATLTREGDTSQSKDSVELMYLQDHSGLTPLVR